MATKQLSIFEQGLRGEIFDRSYAYIRNLNSRTRYTELEVYIPLKSKAINEVEKSTDYDEDYEVFETHVEGLWLYKFARDKKFKYDKAEEICRNARDKQQKVQIRVYIKINEDNYPFEVVKYI